MRGTGVRLAIRLQSERFAGQSVDTREVVLDTHPDAKAAVQARRRIVVRIYGAAAFVLL